MMSWYYDENKRKRGESYYKFSGDIMKFAYFAFCGTRTTSHFLLKDGPKDECCRACDLIALYKYKGKK